MFNNNLVSSLSQLNNITNSVILRYPKTVAISESLDIMVCLDVSAIDPDQFEEIALNNSFSEFLNVFKLFPNDRTVTVSDNVLHVSGDGSNAVFITDDINLLEAFDKSPQQFERTQQVPSVATFEMTDEDMKKIKQASSVFKNLSEVLIASKDGDVSVSLTATNKFNARDNSFSLSKTGVNASKEFAIKLPVENFGKLPVSNYTVDIKYNEAKDSYRILMTNKTFEGLQILLSVKV